MECEKYSQNVQGQCRCQKCDCPFGRGDRKFPYPRNAPQPQKKQWSQRNEVPSLYAENLVRANRRKGQVKGSYRCDITCRKHEDEDNAGFPADRREGRVAQEGSRQAQEEEERDDLRRSPVIVAVAIDPALEICPAICDQILNNNLQKGNWMTCEIAQLSNRVCIVRYDCIGARRGNDVPADHFHEKEEDCRCQQGNINPLSGKA